MSKESIGHEPCTLNKASDHPRDIAELAALVVSDLPPLEPGVSGSLIIFVWRDCTLTIKFPSGRKMYVDSKDGQSLDSTVRELAVETISAYCHSAGIAGAEIRVHKVPPEASTPEQIFAWFESIPGISITVLPPEGIGFGGLVPALGGVG